MCRPGQSVSYDTRIVLQAYITDRRCQEGQIVARNQIRPLCFGDANEPWSIQVQNMYKVWKSQVLFFLEKELNDTGAIVENQIEERRNLHS